MRNKMAKIALSAILLLTMYSPLAVSAVVQPSATTADDFEDEAYSNSLWTYVGAAAAVDEDGASNRMMQLTDSLQNQVGTIWLEQEVAMPFSAKFRYRMDQAGYWGAADGFVFMFNKERNLLPVQGGGMGFEQGNGYGIEFDTWDNNSDFQDPSDFDGSHISLFHNNPNYKQDQLGYTYYSPGVYSETWRYVNILVDEHAVRVYVGDTEELNDTHLVLEWSAASEADYLDATYSGIGFSASTGDISSRHLIDDVVITPIVDQEPPVLTLKGDRSVVTALGVPYQDPGVTVSDNWDWNVERAVQSTIVSGDPAVPGVYMIAYHVSDRAGNAAEPVTRRVQVVDPASHSAIDANADGIDVGDIARSGDLDGDGVVSLQEVRYLLGQMPAAWPLRTVNDRVPLNEEQFTFHRWEGAIDVGGLARGDRVRLSFNGHTYVQPALYGYEGYSARFSGLQMSGVDHVTASISRGGASWSADTEVWYVEEPSLQYANGNLSYYLPVSLPLVGLQLYRQVGSGTGSSGMELVHPDSYGHEGGNLYIFEEGVYALSYTVQYSPNKQITSPLSAWVDTNRIRIDPDSKIIKLPYGIAEYELHDKLAGWGMSAYVAQSPQLYTMLAPNYKLLVEDVNGFSVYDIAQDSGLPVGSYELREDVFVYNGYVYRQDVEFYPNDSYNGRSVSVVDSVYRDSQSILLESDLHLIRTDGKQKMYRVVYDQTLQGEDSFSIDDAELAIRIKGTVLQADLPATHEVVLTLNRQSGTIWPDITTLFIVDSSGNQVLYKVQESY